MSWRHQCVNGPKPDSSPLAASRSRAATSSTFSSRANRRHASMYSCAESIGKREADKRNAAGRSPIVKEKVGHFDRPTFGFHDIRLDLSFATSALFQDDQLQPVLPRKFQVEHYFDGELNRVVH